MASDIAVEVLKEIRNEIRGTNQRLETVESTLSQRMDSLESTMSQRLGTIEATLLDLAEQQRFVVRYTKAISERDYRLEPRVSSLEARVDKLESK
jgi:hypothetical protein